MAINYADKYAQQIDERFNLGALTGGAVNNDYDWIGVETVKVFSVPTVAMGDYSTTGTNRYGDPTELGNEVQELKVTNTPYARRLYFHPEYHFYTGENPSAGGEWLNPYLPGGEKQNYIPRVFARFLKGAL